MPILGGCCCFDLKVGTKVIAIFKLISSIISFISTGLTLLFMAIMGDVVREAIKQEQARNEMLSATPPRDTSYRDTSGQFPRNREYKDRFDEDYYDELYSDYSRKQMNNMLNLISDHLDIIKIVMMVVVILLVIDIIISSCLVHAVRRSRRGLFLPFLTFHWIGLVIDFLCIAAIIIAGILLELPVAVYISIAITSLIVWAIYVYLVLVVTSQYQAMGLIILREDEMSMK